MSIAQVCKWNAILKLAFLTIMILAQKRIIDVIVANHRHPGTTRGLKRFQRTWESHPRMALEELSTFAQDEVEFDG